MLSIGEFSRITRLTVKTLRYYQELGILLPSQIDPETGYRYYNEDSRRRATEILKLKELGFTLKEIQDILKICSKEEELDSFIRNKLEDTRNRIIELNELEDRLLTFTNENIQDEQFRTEQIGEFVLDIPHLAVVELSGTYDSVGEGFRKLYRKFGRLITGPPYGFYYDMEYKEHEARLDAAVALRSEADAPGFKFMSINRRAVKTVHRGPYGTQGEAYYRLFEYCRKKGHTPVPPVIERYIKGPGIIFRRKPGDYLTECILLIE